MFKNICRILVSAIAVAGTYHAAQAADLDFEDPPVLRGGHVVAHSGLYIRGDIGVSAAGDVSFNTTNIPAGSDLHTVSEGLSGGAFVGVGVGYRYNAHLRGDITVEYRAGFDLSAVDQYTCDATSGCTPTIQRNNFYDGNVSSIVAMANAYIDLGHYHGFTPYVGGGIGITRNTISDLRDWDTSQYGGGGWGGTKSKYDLAWALMAGVGYEVNERLTLEAGYRYLNLGDAESGTVCSSSCGNWNAVVEDMDFHDFRLGMRWNLQQHVPYHEPPVIARF